METILGWALCLIRCVLKLLVPKKTKTRLRMRKIKLRFRDFSYTKIEHFD